MQLVTFNQTNVESGSRLGKPTISFGKKGGISISKQCAEIMSIKNGDLVSLVHDNENPEDWYIRKDDDGFKTREVKGGSFIFNNQSLCSLVRENLELDEESSHKFLVASEPTKSGKVDLFAIITSAAGQEEEESEEEEEQE